VGALAETLPPLENRESGSRGEVQLRGSRLNNRVKVLRVERGWSQVELAEKLGVSRQSVYAIECGKFDPSLPLAFKIAELFGMPIEAIFERRRDS
jgi:putative transcriptional regulator